MKPAHFFIAGVTLLQIGASVARAFQGRWAECFMFLGAAMANAAAGFIKVK